MLYSLFLFCLSLGRISDIDWSLKAMACACSTVRDALRADRYAKLSALVYTGCEGITPTATAHESERSPFQSSVQFLGCRTRSGSSPVLPHLRLVR